MLDPAPDDFIATTPLGRPPTLAECRLATCDDISVVGPCLSNGKFEWYLVIYTKPKFEPSFMKKWPGYHNLISIIRDDKNTPYVQGVLLAGL
jgi:hypothetical protein